MSRTTFTGYEFALIICRNPLNGKFLAIDETERRGWWIPGGAVEQAEKFTQAAVREAKEEAGIDVALKGVLKVEHHLFGKNEFRMRVIFYAEPIDPHQLPKSEPDSESMSAEWVTLEEFRQKDNIRGDELLRYGKQVEEGKVYPLDVLEV